MHAQHNGAERVTVRGRVLRGVALALGALAVAGGFAGLVAMLAIEVEREIGAALLQVARGDSANAVND